MVLEPDQLGRASLAGPAKPYPPDDGDQTGGGTKIAK
jgi:hypothetical protein